VGAEKGWPFVAETPSPACLAERSWPRVSLVTPSYQQANYLERTILSVLNQGYPDLEYFVMDGGSTDGSVDLIQRYESKLAGWESEPDRGQSHAVNKGWTRATGTYVWWLNADDMLTPGSLFASVRYLEDHPRAGMVYGDLVIMDAQNACRGRHRYEDFAYAKVLQTGQDISQAGALMRRSCIDQIGYLNEKLHLVMDLEYWHRMALAGIEIDHLAEPLALFRVHDETKTQSSPVELVEERHHVARLITKHPRFLAAYRHLEDTVWSSAYAACARNYVKAGAFGKGLRACWRSLLARPAMLFRPAWWYLVFLNGTGLLLGRDRWLRLREKVRAWRRADQQGPIGEPLQ